MSANGSPSSSGTAAPPVPTITLVIRSGWVAAANRAAEVPTSGATMCGLPRSASTINSGEEPAHRSRGEKLVAAFGCAKSR